MWPIRQSNKLYYFFLSFHNNYDSSPYYIDDCGLCTNAWKSTPK